jgi:hypothetical protein
LKTSSCKAKGRELQILVGKKIAELLNLEFGKDKDVSSRGMGQSGTDICLSPLAKSKFKFATECKNHSKWNVPAAIRQAKANCDENSDWLLVFQKKSRKREERIDPIVILDLDVFINILKKIYED